MNRIVNKSRVVIQNFVLNNGRCMYSSSSSSAGHDDFMFPSVRRLLTEYNLKYSQVKPTGPQGRVLKGDVITYVQSNNLKPADLKSLEPTTTTTTAAATATTTTENKSTTTTTTQGFNVKPPQFEDTPHNNIRKVIATKLTQSKQSVPHMYMTVQCEIDSLLSLRTVLNANSTSKISVNDFVIKACALALRDVPAANCRWDEKAGKTINNPTVDISVAVATDRGLITPIVGKTDTKSLGNIATELKDLAGRARIGKLKPEEFQGGTFSVSNLGMYGITHFNAIINYPQAGILAIGGGRKVIKNRAYTLDELDSLDTTTAAAAGPSVSNVIDVTLSGDNRVFDDEIAATFLDTFKKYISNPQLMML
ncbi:pyruvate dehydrogenase complex [Heterostelium album PN500]|uniref:Pyruvate dehydrogenase complex n=1 Tax=Heterostelium pallidum (strain ATCC 26659 / Pp 5 / PN500) TaxID=670386 RepID=D3B4B2_HETP5|nr:pyruvate dehydrogenase complex [Heterostelium album PN500]EFA84160.1 pyruvate dehydrogenase complex [Heterostelium album PN500]|eukprot:XP_020436277.1 pyruvate dehydrogenase complex [Heterostelium album PN500]